MMPFREALQSIRSLAGAPLQIPEVAKVGAAAEAIKAPAGRMDKPRPGKNYDSIAKETLQRLRTGQPLTPRELRDGAWCLWTTKPALCESPVALATFLTGVAAAERKRPYRALASSFMSSFDADRLGLLTLQGSSLERHRSQAGHGPHCMLHCSYSI
jgi:hypothetical protein